MKNIKGILGAALMILAVAGAFASSKISRVDNIFYLDATNNCVAGQVDQACPLIGSPDCVKPILNTTLTKQIYATQTPSGQPNRFLCSDPYQEPTR